ncbi:hypothetical protein BGZ63DRAFT_106605 [Mariannaea sp. PMI_226]|nr:hypothetical protein BGZ63DRAFT_106605 [Mariannaea sp. PMI_226]
MITILDDGKGVWLLCKCGQGRAWAWAWASIRDDWVLVLAIPYLFAGIDSGRLVPDCSLGPPIDRSSSFREVPCSRLSYLRSSLPDAASLSWATTASAAAPNWCPWYPGQGNCLAQAKLLTPSTTNIWGSPGLGERDRETLAKEEKKSPFSACRVPCLTFAFRNSCFVFASQVLLSPN